MTDAETRLGLYVIRALGRAGCRVTALSNAQAGSVIGFASRYTAERYRLPPGHYGETLPQAIEALAPRHDVLIPVSAWSVLLVASSASLPIRSYIPPLDSLQLALDKRATTRVAREAGVPVPATYDRLDPSSIDRWAEEMRGSFPLVVKFADDRRSGAWNPADRYRIVRSPPELAEEYRRMHALGEFPLVQEYVEGDGYGFFAVFGASSDPVASFCHRRLREYPITGGPSTLCESFQDERLVELGTRLLRALRWKGVAMVEFKRDRKTGEYRLLEINPRFWGSLPLAIHCGVNFPVYQAQLALGLTPRPQNGYPTGRKMRFFFSDLLAVRQQWRSGDRRMVATRYGKEFLDPSIKDGLFDIDDPRPLMTYFWQRLRR